MAGNFVDAGRSVTSKIVAILMTFGNGGSYSLTEIARLTGLPVSTTHRLVTELLDWGMLQRSSTGRFSIGMQLQAIVSRAAVIPPNLHERARRVMEDLAAVSPGAVVRLGVLEDLDVTYIEHGPGKRPASLAFDTTTAPPHATAMGRALLAFAPASLVDMVIERGLTRHTPHTVTAPDRFLRALSVIRLTRLAVCRREYEPDVSAAAVPVFAAGGTVVAALEMSFGGSEDLRVVRPPLLVAGRALTRDLQSDYGRPSPIAWRKRHLDLVVNNSRLNMPGQRAAW
jgi:DNA-binding IclR family transcriptional regulator